MSKILFINACMRTESRTEELAKCVLEKLQGNIEEVKLYEKNLSPLNLESFQIRNQAFLNKDFSNELFDLAKQFAEAETIVVAAPYWDLMFPAILKVYFETITVNGLTFKYGANGIPQGLCKAKKLIYVTTSGGPIFKNFGYEYVSTIAKTFFNIEDTAFISAQGLDIHGADVEKILSEAKNDIKL